LTELHPVLIVFLAALATALATGLGAIPFAFISNISGNSIAIANAIAAGLMLGASFGLVSEGAAYNGWATFVGANLGVLFILIAQKIMGDHDIDFVGATGVSAKRMLLIVVVMTVHSFAEGVAVGVSFGGGESLAAAITIAIAVHNIPEGLAISAVMRPRGASLAACIGWSIFSSLPQPITAVPAFIFVERFASVLPYGLGFASGAMVFMVLVELLPEAYEQALGRSVGLITGLTLVAMLLFQHFL
jgi:zinc transporter, ZIP family